MLSTPNFPFASAFLNHYMNFKKIFTSRPTIYFDNVKITFLSLFDIIYLRKFLFISVKVYF